ncbi:MAG: carboxylate-amine ligase [Solirubrobacterales bacterium]
MGSIGIAAAFERPPAVLEHNFSGPAFTIGVEEELMILNAEDYGLAQEIEAILDDIPGDLEGYVKPELMQAVLEIATTPCPDVPAAARQLAQLRRRVSGIADGHGLVIGASATHPFALWEQQLIVDRPRYHQIASELAYIARRELIFGTHVHVGVEGADRAVYIADGIRWYIPLLLALSSNSPFWRGEATGLMSSRTPIFRAFPRVGVPPHYGTWEIYSNRVELMMRAGAIEDYTFLWWDVRPHPSLGTVEVRVFDQQTRLEHTVALTALTASLAHRLSALYDDEEPLIEQPTELVDDNKVRAALGGMEGELIDFRAGRPLPAPAMAERMLDELAEHADELGCRAELEGVRDLIEHGTGARRQLDILERNGDLTGLMREIVERTRV